MRKYCCDNTKEGMTEWGLNKVISMEIYRIIIYVEERIKKRPYRYQYKRLRVHDYSGRRYHCHY